MRRARSILRVGLTGGIACGKSAVTRELGRLGCTIIDADLIAREVVEPGRPGWKKVVEHFGERILLPDSQIDRSALARIVFAKEAQRRALNRILHPLIIEVEEERIGWLVRHGFRGIVIVEAALLIEAGRHKNYDQLIVVYCDPKVQLKRLTMRDGISIAEARRRIRAQMDIEEKKKLATHVIDASGSLRDTQREVQKVYCSIINEFLRRGETRAEPPAG
ncbi:MAG: dephospho-CoA kinase [Acidobacteriota bacterium]